MSINYSVFFSNKNIKKRIKSILYGFYNIGSKQALAIIYFFKYLRLAD